ncbi:putative transporter [Teratosphaeria destructans]|uniref:Transporter n=1 Tax=Teratosphaeria destructans TaxID=418781 RepID=A0A9W7T1W9_9PEZI|nr:putative transporter [Teratosphaeria destructans]
MTPTTDYAQDPYSWDNLSGWKSYRTLRPLRGMYWDVRRRLPYYWSDITDGFTYRTFAATVRIFFVNLLPALAFELDMMRQTGGYFGINEALFSSALAALVFSTLGCQPLTVVGITGLISLFNYTIYDIAKAQGIVELYPQFIAWGVEELVAQFSEEGSSWTAGYLSIVIALCYWFSVTVLEMMGGTIYFTPVIRKLLSDYAYPIATIFWTGFSHIPGRIKSSDLLRIPHTRAFYPTVDRGWLVDFWTLPVKWVFVALPIGILLTLLFYYDHNVSSLTAQAKQFPLKKPAGFHWDFFLLGCTCFIGGIIGIPLPNGLVPQAPVHTDACTEYVDRLSRTKEQELENNADRATDAVWIEHNSKVVEAKFVHEQRISHFIMALGFVGLMTGPLLVVLHTMPRALFAGVFFVVGWGSISGMNITANLLYCISERRFVDDGDPRNRVKKWRILYYTFWQVLGVAISVAISQTIAAIGFPVIIVALIPLRWVILPRIFTEEELLILDAPTADADVVLASMGGRPTLPEVKMAEERRRLQGDDGETGVTSSWSSSDGNGQATRSRSGFKDAEELEMERERGEKAAREGIAPTLRTGHA